MFLLSGRGHCIFVILLLGTQAGLLAFSATRHSPTNLEPAFLASGLNHWQTGNFELYRVNPPLVRMVAAGPLLAFGCKTDWSHLRNGPGSRAEFVAGNDFIKANGSETIRLVFWARWACIPFCLTGAFFASRWSDELYGKPAGLVTLALFVFEPNLLAHGELITPDVACTSLGILAGYTFWRWLKEPNWIGAVTAGVSLGVAELTKSSLLLLLGLWPVLWIVWRQLGEQPTREHCPRVPHSQLPSQLGAAPRPKDVARPPFSQLAGICLIAVYIMNAGYVFDGSGTQLKNFQFVSTLMTGLQTPGEIGNRFRSSILGEIPIPVPSQYVLGLDLQKKDFENFGHPSYLRGEWKSSGWWYYYLYGLGVKVPCGAWALFVVTVVSRLMSPLRPVAIRDELVLLMPAACLLGLVSSQTEFNMHLRYVFPSLGLALIFLGQLPCISGKRHKGVTVFTCGMLAYCAISTLLVYPHHLAYFNDFVGGSKNGHKHLLGSNLDWGQDLLYLRGFIDSVDDRKVQSVSADTLYSPRDLAIFPDGVAFHSGVLPEPNKRGASLQIYSISVFLQNAQLARSYLDKGAVAFLSPTQTFVVTVPEGASHGGRAVVGCGLVQSISLRSRVCEEF